MNTEKSENAGLFWDKVKELIKKKKLTQKELSEKLGFNIRAVETWINQSTYPNARQAVLIADELNTSVEYLVFGKKPKTIEKIPADLQEVINKYAKNTPNKKEKGKDFLLTKAESGDSILS